MWCVQNRLKKLLALGVEPVETHDAAATVHIETSLRDIYAVEPDSRNTTPTAIGIPMGRQHHYRAPPVNRASGFTPGTDGAIWIGFPSGASPKSFIHVPIRCISPR